MTVKMDFAPSSLSALCSAQELAQDRVIGQLEVVATFDGAMPTGVTVANSGRIFVNFPRWGDKVEYTVAEVKGRKDGAVSFSRHQPLRRR